MTHHPVPATRRPAATVIRRRLAIAAVGAAILSAALVTGLVLADIGASGSRLGDTHGTSTPQIIADTETGQIPEGGSLGANDDHAAVARLDPELRAAVARASADAAADGIRLGITSGWRSRGYQDALFAQAVTTYGSEADAAKWVADPDASAHVQGLAVDIGPTDAYSWLQQHGAEYGLCNVYANESWHFELRDLDAAGSCPRTYADATEDPRRW